MPKPNPKIRPLTADTIIPGKSEKAAFTRLISLKALYGPPAFFGSLRSRPTEKSSPTACIAIISASLLADSITSAMRSSISDVNALA